MNETASTIATSSTPTMETTSTTATTPLTEATTTTMKISTEANIYDLVTSTTNFILSTVITPESTTGATSPSTIFVTESTTDSTIFSNTITTPNNVVIKEKLSVGDLSTSLQLFGIMDYLIFVLMLTICAVIGIYFGFIEKSGKKINRKEQRRGSEALDYLVGGRKMKVFPVSLSLIASFVSGISLLGTSTEVYVYGTQYVFLLVTIVITGFISWHIFLPVFCNLQLTSTYEYFEMRFNKNVRLFGSVLFIIGTCFWLPIVIYVPALAFNQVTGINIHIVTPVVCIVCIFYTCVGGLKAVVWTDVIQTFIMLGAIVLVIIKGTSDVGGLQEVLKRNYESGRLESPALTFDHTVRYSFMSVFLGSTLHWVQSTCANQVMMQRFLSVPNLKSARHALIIFTVGVVILLGCCAYNGLLIYATYHKCDPLSTGLAKAPDQLVPLLVMDILGTYPGISGLFVAGVFSAALSSLSTGLNSLSAVCLEDFVKPYKKIPLTERETAIFVRAAVVVFGVICVALVFVVEKLGMVLQLSSSMSAMTSGPLLGIFFMGLCLPWINWKSALTGGLAGTIIVGWICGRAQMDMVNGVLKFPVKPISTEECSYTFINSIKNSSFVDDLPESKPLHHMSFMFYTAFGILSTIIIANISCLFFGTTSFDELDENCIAPFIRKLYWPRKYQSVEMNVNNLNELDEKNKENLG